MVESDLSVLCSLIPRNRIGHTSVDIAFYGQSLRRARDIFLDAVMSHKTEKRLQASSWLPYFPLHPGPNTWRMRGTGGANEMT